MASKEEILRTVLTVLDRLTAIETQLSRLEHPPMHGCPDCGHACGVWNTGIICADVSKFNSSTDRGNLNGECHCANPYHRAYKDPLD